MGHPDRPGAAQECQSRRRRCRPAFNEVNQAQQEKEKRHQRRQRRVQQGRAAREGEAEQKISEAEATQRSASTRPRATWSPSGAADGIHEGARCHARRIYLETMAEVLPMLGKTVILDEKPRDCCRSSTWVTSRRSIRRRDVR